MMFECSTVDKTADDSACGIVQVHYMYIPPSKRDNCAAQTGIPNERIGLSIMCVCVSPGGVMARALVAVTAV